MENKNTVSGWALAAGLFGLAVAGVMIYYKKRPMIPQGIKAVKGFDLNRYLGCWYEVCRMPMAYEKNLTRVTAEYFLNPNGSVRVVNSGFDERRNRWQRAVGHAVPVGDPKEGKLKVSFFGPFYAGYNVVEIDPEYKYALVFGHTLDYMWILSREPDIPEDVLRRYMERAVAAGYDHYRLIWTDHEIY